MAPIGKSLRDSFLKKNVSQELQQIILDKFEKVMEEQFEAILPNTSRSNCVGKNKLQADAESYNNVF